MKRMPVLLLLLLLLVASAAAATPARFGPNSAHVTNPWFPLKPATTFVYRGEKDGKPARDVVTVTPKVAVIGGVRCAVVYDKTGSTHGVVTYLVVIVVCYLSGHWLWSADRGQPGELP